jgi:hypothetical protein
MPSGVPVPLPYSDDPRHLLDWAFRLAAWLAQETSGDYDFEEVLGVGGIGMANRLYGVEHIWTPALGVYEECVAAPEAGKKRIVTWTHTVGEAGQATLVQLIKKIDTIEVVIGEASIPNNGSFSENGPTQIVLDGVLETLGIKTNVAGGIPYSFEATVLNVD